MAAGQIVIKLNVREDEHGALFLEAGYKVQPCGCEVVGAGTLTSLLDIKFCPMHAAAQELHDAVWSLMKAYGAVDGRNGNSGECWDKARAAIAKAKA